MGKKFSHTYKKKKWLKGSCWSKCEYTIHNQIIHLQIVCWLTSVVWVWIEIAVQTVECATAKRNESNYNLDFGYYEQTEMFHLLWKAVTVPTVECTTAICKTKLIKLPFGCYEQTELCPLLWVDVTGPFIVRFVPDGKFTLPPNTLYFSFIYCHSCRSWMQIYLIS